MTIDEAVAKAKRECLILEEFLTDEQIKEFLNDSLDDGYDFTDSVINNSIVNMLKAILPVAPVSYTRGNISITRLDIERVLKEFQNKQIGSINLRRG